MTDMCDAAFSQDGETHYCSYKAQHPGPHNADGLRWDVIVSHVICGYQPDPKQVPCQAVALFTVNGVRGLGFANREALDGRDACRKHISTLIEEFVDTEGDRLASLVICRIPKRQNL